MYVRSKRRPHLLLVSSIGMTTPGHDLDRYRRLRVIPLKVSLFYRPEDYTRPRDSVMNAPVRGRMILISVNSPGCVSTSIDPECCFTMMS